MGGVRRGQLLSHLVTAIALAVAAAGFDCASDQVIKETPDVLWHASGEGWSLPAFDSASVYFPGMHHQLVALNKTTGQQRWQVRVPYVATCPSLDTAVTFGHAAVMAGGSVVTADDGLFAFDPATGSLRWSFHAPGCTAEASTPGSDGQRVYAGSTGAVYALDGATGTVAWTGQFLPDSEHAIAYSPVRAGNAVYAEFTVPGVFLSDSGGVVALDAGTGTPLWVHYFPRTLTTMSPQGTSRVAISGNVVVAPSNDGMVYGLDRTSGGQLWQVGRLDTVSQGDLRPVATSGNTVAIGSNRGTIVAVLAGNGQVAWSATNAGAAQYLTADSLDVYSLVGFSSTAAYNGVTGVLAWRFGLIPGSQFEVLTPAAADSNRIYVGGPSGLYAVRR